MSNAAGGHPLSAAGPKQSIETVKWTASNAATQTLTESWGIVNVTRTSAGLYVVNIRSGSIKNCQVLGCNLVPADTNFHSLYVSAISNSGKTVTLTHATCTYANIVAVGPAASDTAGEIHLTLCIRRVT